MQRLFVMSTFISFLPIMLGVAKCFPIRSQSNGDTLPTSTKSISANSFVLHYIETEDLPIQISSLKDQRESIPPGRDRLAESVDRESGAELA